MTTKLQRIIYVIAVCVGSLLALGGLMGTPDTQAAQRQLTDRRNGGTTVILTSTSYLPVVTNNYDPRVMPFGFQFFALDGSPLDYAMNADVRWIRSPVSWASIEPVRTTPRTYNWSTLDYLVSHATERGAELILTISDQPSWASVYPMGPLVNTQDLVDFVSALVGRYGGDSMDDAPGSPQVRYFELYNEPDNTDPSHAMTGGWGYWGYNGAGYAQLLQALYPAVKAANSEANLVMGGIAMDWFVEEGGVFDSHFLEDVLTACEGKKCFDVMNFHYYPPFRDHWELYGADIIGKANYIRQRLAAHGFVDMPLLCTEASWGSGGDWGSDELQSRYTVKLLVRGMAAKLRTVTWYAMVDTQEAYRPGVLDSQLQPKPSYWALKRAVAMLKPAMYQRGLTETETGSKQIEGYMFLSNGRRLDLAWTEADPPWDMTKTAPQLPLAVNAYRLRVTDKLGNETWLSSPNGWITVTVDGSPLYLEYYP